MIFLILPQSVTETNNNYILKTDTCMTAIPTYHAVNQSIEYKDALCRDSSHTCVSFQTVLLFVSVTD